MTKVYAVRGTLSLALAGVLLGAAAICGCSQSGSGHPPNPATQPNAPAAGSNTSGNASSDGWPLKRDARVGSTTFPEWAFSMKLWPFDILMPNFTNADIDQRLQDAVNGKANAVIVYIEEEHMYGSFVDDAGFATVKDRIAYLASAAKARNLRVIVYLNGLEVMTQGAVDPITCASTGIPTMSRVHPDWLQRGLNGQPIVYTCQNQDWLQPDWEDAWMSPLSGYRDFFKQRVVELAGAGIDAVYVDNSSLPGYQPASQSFSWGTTDAAFEAAFKAKTGFDLPTVEDLNSPEFRAFLKFRHEVLADYLGDIAQTARDNGLVAFWESSTLDGQESTTLGNETAATGRMGLGFSPEVEPEGDWAMAFRAAKAARELNQERPMIYLSFPGELATGAVVAAEIHYAISLAHSNTYYPTDVGIMPQGAFEFMTSIQTVLTRRVPYGGDLALVYSVRNKDLTYPTESGSRSYASSFKELASRHLPFRIVALEYLSADLPGQGVDGIGTVVLPSLEAMSGAEAALLSSRRRVELNADAANRDEDGQPRSSPLQLGAKVTLNDLVAVLPFTLTAPTQSLVEFYGDKDGAKVMYLFVVSPTLGGSIDLSATGAGTLNVELQRRGAAPKSFSGKSVSVPVSARLMVLTVTSP